MKPFNPLVINSEIEVPIELVKDHEFDVRDTLDNREAVNELVRQGGPKRLPFIFQDNVVPDGRTSYRAQLAIWEEAHPGQKAATAKFQLLKGRWADMSVEEKEAVRFWALNQNSPSKFGYRRYTTDADIVKTLFDNQLTTTPLTIEEALALIDAPVSQIRRAYRQAANQATTYMMARVRAKVDADDVTPSAAARELGIPKRIVEAIKSAPKNDDKPGSGMGRMSPKAYVDNRQPQLNKAHVAVKRYGDAVIDEHKKNPHKMSATTAMKVAETHVRTAQRILDAAVETQSRVNKAILAMTPGAHRP